LEQSSNAWSFEIQLQGTNLQLATHTTQFNSDSRGFAFLTFEKLESAEEAIKTMHRTLLEGRYGYR